MTPKITIGLPVYNGAALLSAALDSLLGQTLGDFELIIADNASTDATPEICRRYARRDRRIRYLGADRNLGAAANFNRVVPLARGEYFKWAAHDDCCEPEFLQRCAAVLDAEPAVVLATTRTRRIDATGRPLDIYDFDLDCDGADPVERFARMLRGHKCYEVFGLIRTATLRQTDLIGHYAHGDGVLLADLALRGRLREIPEPLFLARSHESQSMAMVLDYHAYTGWFDPAKAGRLVFPCWRILREYLRVIGRAPISARQRLACYRHVAAWCVHWRRRLRGDLTAAVRHVTGIGRPRPARRPDPTTSSIHPDGRTS